MLISLLVFVIIAGLIWWLLTQLPIPDPFRTVVMVIFVVICILWLVGSLGYLGDGPFYHHHSGHSLP